MRAERAIAAVDVGSNAIRLQIMGVRPSGALIERESIREPVRLGHRVFLTGRLEYSGIHGAVSVLSAFRAAMDRHRVVYSRCVATSAVREAQNKDEFLEQVRSRSGLKLEVISGAEETRLLTVAIQRKLDISKHRALLVDIGGGSVEFAVVHRGRTIFSQSHRLGAVRMLEFFLENSKKSGERGVLLYEYFDRMLKDTIREIRRHAPAMQLAVGGNAETLGRIAGGVSKARPVAGPFVDRDDLHDITKKLIHSDADERAKRYDLRPDRVDTIVPAAALLDFLAGELNLKGFFAPGIGLRDGILAELADQAAGRDDRQEAELGIMHEAERLGQHYQYDEMHAKKVREIALSIYERLRERRKLNLRKPDRDRLLLAVAATVHDIGEFVDYASHHKHGWYLLTNSEIGGLTAEEMQIIALSVRYHRRALPSERHPEYASITNENQSRVRRLAAILRVADALDREHRQKVGSIALRIKDRELIIVPRAKGDLALERWALATKDELFEKEYGLSLKLTIGAAQIPETPSVKRARLHANLR